MRFRRSKKSPKEEFFLIFSVSLDNQNNKDHEEGKAIRNSFSSEAYNGEVEERKLLQEVQQLRRRGKRG